MFIELRMRRLGAHGRDGGGQVAARRRAALLASAPHERSPRTHPRILPGGPARRPRP